MEDWSIEDRKNFIYKELQFEKESKGDECTFSNILEEIGEMFNFEEEEVIHFMEKNLNGSYQECKNYMDLAVEILNDENLYLNDNMDIELFDYLHHLVKCKGLSENMDKENEKNAKVVLSCCGWVIIEETAMLLGKS